MAIEPALCAGEWARKITPDGAAGIRDDGTIWLAPEADETDEPHALAALCLYEQEFGFTREDVDVLRGISRCEFAPGHDGLDSLADRIEALLPPKGDL